MRERGQKQPETQKIVTESLQTQREYIDFTPWYEKKKKELSAVIVLKFKLNQTSSRLFTSSRSKYLR